MPAFSEAYANFQSCQNVEAQERRQNHVDVVVVVVSGGGRGGVESLATNFSVARAAFGPPEGKAQALRARIDGE
jgi:NADH dehydrogenase FAD-containing subunit